MLAQDLRLHAGRVDVQPARDVEAEAKAVQRGPRADDALVPEHADEVGERIRRIGDDHDHRVRRSAVHLRDDLPVGPGVGVEQAQAAGRISPVRRTPGLLVDARGDQHHRRAGEISEISVLQHGVRAEDRAVLEVGDDALCLLPIAVDQHHLRGEAARDHGGEAGDSDPACTHDSHLHGESPSTRMIIVMSTAHRRPGGAVPGKCHLATGYPATACGGNARSPRSSADVVGG